MTINCRGRQSVGAGPRVIRGFTLIEMMIVISIISILATMALPSFQKSLVRAKETNLRRSLFIMRDTIDQYFADHGRYPGSLLDLDLTAGSTYAHVREVTGRRELYRRLSRIADSLVDVADRVWYAAVKEA